jgi:subtilisin family serine protease
MKKFTLICAIVMVLSLVFNSTVAMAASPPEKVRVFIGFNQPPGQSEENLVRSLGGEIKYTYHIIPAIAAYVPETAIQGLLRNPRVTVIEPDVTIQATDAELSNSWGVEHIGAGVVHASGNKGAGVKVAIIDTGIDYNNPEFAGRYAGGYDFVNGDNDPMDDEGHGTHVAGIIAAADDGSGVVGVAPEAEIYALKVLDENGSGSFFDVIAALDWVCGNYGSPPRAYITNNSYGSTGYPGSLVQQAFDFSNALWGVLNIAAAGNSGTPSGMGDNVEYPGRFGSVVAVAATDRNDIRGYFSSTGPDVELAAPGVAITSTVLNNEYETWSGTSMASPHVAGTAALVIASGIQDTDRDGFINDEIRQRLVNSTLDLGASGRDTQYGWGLIDAEAAAEVSNPPPPQPQTVTVSEIETGTYEGRGRNKSFTEKTSFATGDTIVFRASVQDDNGQPISGAVVEFDLTGPQEVTLTSTPSDDNGLAVATWKTQKPRKRAQGTPTGTYDVSITGVNINGYLWDGEAPGASFSLQ